MSYAKFKDLHFGDEPYNKMQEKSVPTPDMSFEGYTVTTNTWSWKPLFTKEMVENITRKATRWQRARLLLRPSHYAVDGKSVIRYKEMDGITFVMKRGTKL